MDIDYKNFLKKHFNVILAVISFLIFIVVTFKANFLSHRMCWEDEAHFWTIVQNLNVFEIFKLMKVEGHMLLWYLVVMPFAKLPIPYYPYPMVALNWLFCLGALIIMWKKAPFNPVIKAMIVLSPAFIVLYGVHARCYSIGIFFLFAACALYKDRLKHPYRYFLILFLAANTSFQALLCAFALGIIFLIELFIEGFKDKSLLKEPLLITLFSALTAVMLYFQLYGAPVPDYEQQARTMMKMFTPFAAFIGTIKVGEISMALQIILLRILFLAACVLMLKKWKALFVFLFPMIVSFVFFLNTYNPRLWHTLFLLVYCIVAYWIFLYENPGKYTKNLMTAIIFALLAAAFVYPVNLPVANDFLSPTIMKSKVLKNAKLFSNIEPITLSIVLPKFNENGIYIYDLKNRNLSSFEMLDVYFNKEGKKFTEADVKNSIDPTRRNFILTTLDKRKDFSSMNLNKKLYIKGSRGGIKYYIYEIFPDDKK